MIFGKSCASLRGGLLGWGVLAAGLLGLPAAASAEYGLAPGDVIEVAVANMPELRQRVTVQMNGTIALTQIGDVAVAGLSPQAMREKVQKVLASTALRQRAGDGRDSVYTVEPDEVSASVVEFRPVYVTGDVARPGEQPFHMGMNLRQAVAIAGGYGLPRLAQDPLRVVELRAEARALWGEYASERARIWRVRAQLGSAAAFDATEFKTSPVAGATLDQILDLEKQSLSAWQADRKREQAFLEQAVAQVQASIAIVSQQKTDEEKGTAADADDLNTVLDLMRRGNVTSSRVNEARRAVLLASTRNLQTQAELLRLQRQKDDFSEQLAKGVDQRRISLLQDLQAAISATEQTRVKLAGAEDKLRLAGLTAVRTGSGRQPPSYAVFRKTTGEEARIAADERTELVPGDVVEVTLPNGPDLLASAP